MAGRLALPIDEHLPRIVETLRERGALVLVAEPGAGKTTRVPPALFDAGLADRGEIVVLEPRRIAARLAARHVAEERGEDVGRTIGYEVRYERAASAATRVRYVTYGILAQRIATDPRLRGVGVVVIDELHERQLDADFVLAWVARLRRQRPDLALVAMSATLDAERVAAFLDAPVIDVPGRVFPVAIEHEPKPDDRPLATKVASTAGRLAKATPEGDVLVFLPGAREIREAGSACEPLATKHGLDIVPLHGDLPPEAQDRAVHPSARRRIVLSTNVAESSVTLPSVVAVVDSGLARIASTSAWTGFDVLRVGKVSRASAIQRAGRAGRVREGLCARLYTEHDFRTRPEHDEPEIRRVDLASLVLRLVTLGEDPRAFPFFEPPSAAALDAALALLERLGALDAGGVTSCGRALAALPVHPRQAKLAVEAQTLGAGARGVLLAALLAERDPRKLARTRFDEARIGAEEMGRSDLLRRLEAFEAAEAERFDRGALRALELDAGTLANVRKLRDRLADALSVPRAPDALLVDEEDALLEATLAAFPDRVGRVRDGRRDEVVFAAGGSAKLGRDSVAREAKLLVAFDVGDLEGRAWIRGASEIEPEQLLERYPDRIAESVELRFDPETEQVERRTRLLYDGLVLDESVRRDVEGDDVADVLARAARDAGLSKVFDLAPVEALLARVCFAATHGFEASVDPTTVLDVAVRAACAGARSFADLRRRSLFDVARGLYDPKDLHRLDRFAPEHVSLPGRARVAVGYGADQPPWIESRMQDFFGLADGPRIAEGRVALVLHLLAPNQRAVQVTTDLAGFWERHYPGIRKELMRRYTRHAWPDDPRNAKPPAPRRR